MLVKYFEVALSDKLASYPADVREAWWAEVFDASGAEQWGAVDWVKDEVKQILDFLELEDDLRYAIWYTIDWPKLMERLRRLRRTWTDYTV